MRQFGASRVSRRMLIGFALLWVTIAVYAYFNRYVVINDDGKGVIVINTWWGEAKRVDGTGYSPDHLP